GLLWLEYPQKETNQYTHNVSSTSADEEQKLSTPFRINFEMFT
ncbi:hypothetical protein AVEN_248006-1, partial [Araneus ventricosus]